MMSPEPTASPAARSSLPNLTSKRTIRSRSATGGLSHRRSQPPEVSATGGDVREVVADKLEVVALLHDRAQRVAGRRLAEVGLAEEMQSPGPVDRLGDTGWLGEVQLAEPVHGRNHLTGERLTDTRFLQQHDLRFPVRGRISDPVVQAAPFQGVVKFPGAVRGKNHQRRAVR